MTRIIRVAYRWLISHRAARLPDLVDCMTHVYR